MKNKIIKQNDFEIKEIKQIATKSINLDINKIVEKIKKIHTNFILYKKILYKLEVYQAIFGKTPYRWSVATISYKSVLKKRNIFVEVYSEAYDIKITLDDELELYSFDKPKEVNLLLQLLSNKDNLYTRRRVEERLKIKTNAKNIIIIKKALEHIIQKSWSY